MPNSEYDNLYEGVGPDGVGPAPANPVWPQQQPPSRPPPPLPPSPVPTTAPSAPAPMMEAKPAQPDVALAKPQPIQAQQARSVKEESCGYEEMVDEEKEPETQPKTRLDLPTLPESDKRESPPVAVAATLSLNPVNLESNVERRLVKEMAQSRRTMRVYYAMSITSAIIGVGLLAAGCAMITLPFIAIDFVLFGGILVYVGICFLVASIPFIICGCILFTVARVVLKRTKNVRIRNPRIEHVDAPKQSYPTWPQFLSTRRGLELKLQQQADASGKNAPPPEPQVK